MDAEAWRSEQRRLRQAVRSHCLDGHSSKRTEPLAGTEHPFVSVIVVCFNAEKILGRCLEQLRAQDYPRYEVIVVDDGSRDRTRQAAERALAGGNVRIVGSRTNRGVARARNIGLDHARGDIIAFIDADGYAAPDWVSRLVARFESDDSIGGVASTVFYADNPLVINGAGGTINRQGWAADLAMNESFEHAQLAGEALYPMGCGMAVRRSAAERVGPFDDRIINYYDDVDYGIRLWRAGLRVVVAADAWIDHELGGERGESPHKPLLCERHRVRVVLKHASVGSLRRWAAHELRALRRSPRGHRAMKLRAMGWNALHLPSGLLARWRLRGALPLPDHLVDRSWGGGFPAGVPPAERPRPETATNALETADRRCEGQLLYGWFPPERIGERSCRWAAGHAAVLMRVDAAARRLRLDYAHVPADIGGVDVRIRRVGSQDPLACVWSTRLAWQYIERSVENQPLSLSAGDYEVLFSAREPWLEAPLETRSLALALVRMSLEPAFEVPSGRGLQMSFPAVEDQLVSGWFEPEQSAGLSYRWASAHAAAVVNIARGASCAHITYRLPPVPSDVSLSVRPIDQQAPTWSTRIAWRDAEWHRDSFSLRLPGGEYLLTVDAETPWSNPGQRDPSLWAENRSLGLALSSVSFERLR